MNLTGLIRRSKTALCLLFAAPLAFILQSLAFSHPAALERIYSQSVYPVIAQALSLLTGLVPFSLGEWLLLSSPVWLAALSLMFFSRLRNKGASIPVSLLGVLIRLCSVCSCLFLSFMLFCGLNYARQPYADIAGYDVSPVSVAELKLLYFSLVDEANKLRAELPEDINGCYQLSEPLAAAARRVQDNYALAAVDAPWLGGTYGRIKFVVFSDALAYTQITGIYFPFTAEANVNRVNSPMMYAATIAHEAAHQRGFMREDEANFIAWYVCSRSGDIHDRYSATALALIHTGNALYGADSDAYYRIRSNYSPALERDFAHNSRIWQKYEGPIAEAQEAVNDAYLKSNNQNDGVKSYGRMVDLLVAQMRKGL